ncbi:CsbD family protein [Methylobacterium terricola]|uniref:CsbD family protein n=1 Tax=Methylobacterium terricola TaxID=2583531 RepID=A0A5C4LAN2_9HYPH|nr:CsbD family protein [Methylobacterium terricola]TNC09890.1 CsbD family protein [Methylobacterium terricola]
MTERAPKTSTEQVKDSVKEAIGKLTGDVRVEAEGRRQRDEAKAPRGPAPRPD